ncbi:arylsulfatase B-like isoform X2 [Amblyomma americanum]
MPGTTGQQARDVNVSQADVAASRAKDPTPTAKPSEGQSEPRRATSTSKTPEAGSGGCTDHTLLWSAGFVALGALVIAVVIVLFLRVHTREYEDPNGPKKTPPHIVFILADDLGWGDISYNGNPQIRTPNIDALAWNGVRLTRLYHQPLCTPTRAAIMTGRYPIHTGMQHFVILMSEARGLPLDLKILPEWLNDLGYTSYIMGKWHLGFYKSVYTPTKRGFVSHVGSWGGGIDYYSHQRSPINSSDSGLDFRRNLTLAINDSGRYFTEIVTEESLSIIKNHPVEKPMFLYVTHFAPHYGTVRDPLQAPPRYLQGYDFIGHRNRTIYAGMVSALDESVGKIFAALQDRGILDDTFFIFCSDNGAAATFYDANAASPWPLRGEKFTLWEGGVRAPGFLWTAKKLWTGAGSDYDHFFHATDWLPTLYELAGGDLSQLADIDGVSHFQSLHNPTNAAPRNEVLLNINPVDRNAGIIQGRYKLIYGRFPVGVSHWINIPGAREPAAKETELARQSCQNSQAYKVLVSRGVSPKCGLGDDVYTVPVNCGENSTKNSCDSDPGPCLYDIIADPCEYHDIASENPDVVKRLQDRLEALQKGAVKPSNLKQDPESFPSRHGGAWVPWKDDVPV